MRSIWGHPIVLSPMPVLSQKTATVSRDADHPPLLQSETNYSAAVMDADNDGVLDDWHTWEQIRAAGNGEPVSGAVRKGHV